MSSIGGVLVAAKVFVRAENVVGPEIKTLRTRIGPTRRSRSHIARIGRLEIQNRGEESRDSEKDNGEIMNLGLGLPFACPETINGNF